MFPMSGQGTGHSGIDFSGATYALPTAALPTAKAPGGARSSSGVSTSSNVSTSSDARPSSGGRLLLDNITLALEPGTTTAVLGRSGSGKTTLLRLVNGLVLPTKGEVRVRGESTAASDLIELRRSIGYVIQESGLFPHFTVERNVGMVPELQGSSQRIRVELSQHLLKEVGLDPGMFAQRYPWQLSGGQRQRVGLARALAAEPDILLMDEPFGALDPMTRFEMQEMLLRLLSRLRKTVLLVTHDLHEAIYLASRIIFLEGGRVVADLPSQEIMTSNLPDVRQYVSALQHTAGPNAAGPNSAEGREPAT